MVEMVCAKCLEWEKHEDYFSSQCKVCESIVKTTKTYVIGKHFNSGSGCYGTTVLTPKDGGPGQFPSNVLPKYIKGLPEGTEIELTVISRVTKEVPKKEFCQNPFGRHRRCEKG